MLIVKTLKVLDITTRKYQNSTYLKIDATDESL